MPAWLIANIATAGATLIGIGVLIADLARVKRDVADCVRRELYDANMRSMNDKLDKIERTLERLLDIERAVARLADRMPRRTEDTDPGIYR
jgi:hypothetical protein